MAPNDREERRRQRQRGAGIGAVSTASFGFTFGSSAAPQQPAQPLPPRRSSRPTPQRLPSQKSSRNTPAPLPIRTSARKTPSIRSGSVGESSQQPSSGRLQRLKSPFPSGITIPETTQETQDDELERMLGLGQPSNRTSTPATRRSVGSRRQSAVTPGLAVEDAQDELEQNEEGHSLSADRGGQQKTPGVSSEASTRSIDDEAANTAPKTATTKKKLGRPQKSVAAVSPVAEEAAQATPGAKPVSEKRPRGRPRKSLPAVDAGALDEIPVATTHEDEERDELSPITTKVTAEANLHTGKRKRRGNRSLVAKAATPTIDREDEAEAEDRDELSPVTMNLAVKPSRKSSQRAFPDSQSAEPEQASDDELSPRRSNPQNEPEARNLGKQPQNGIDEEANEESAAEGADTPQPTARPPKTTKPTPTKRRGRPPKSSGPKASKPATADASPPRKRQKRTTNPGETFPVNVLRFSRVAPTDPERPETALKPRLPQVSAVDVLAQITGEVTSQWVLNYENQASRVEDRPRRADLKRGAKAIKAFGIHLEDRLFDLQASVDANANLEARVKALNREKMVLRKEWLNVRAERERIAFQMDEVRRKHAQAEKERRDGDFVNDTLFDIEVAVQRGKARAKEEKRENEGPEISLEWTLREVTGAVGSDGRGGGLLGKVRSFNKVLERTAQVVEGRA